MADKLWAPTRGYFEIGEGGASAPRLAAADDAPEVDESPAGEDAGPRPAAAAPPAGGGTKCWAPTRGYFVVGAGGGGAPAAKAAPAKKPAAKDKKPAAAAGEEKPAPAAAAKKSAAPAKKAAPAATEKKAAPAAAAAQAPAADSARESVTTVPTLTESEWGKSLGGQFYSEPDSETTLYRVPVLNVAFAVTSAVMLVYFALVVWDDYWRPWKEVQARWNELEVSLLEKKLNEARATREERAAEIEPELRTIVESVLGESAQYALNEAAALPTAYQRTQELLESTREGLRSIEVYQELRDAVARAETVEKFADNRLRVIRSDYQAAKYVYEQKKAHALEVHGNSEEGARKIEELAEEFKEKYDRELDRRVREFEEREEARKKAQEALDTYLANHASTEGKTYLDLEATLTRFGRESDEISGLIFQLETNWRNSLRNAPIIDALAPTYQIRKQVIPDIQEDLNFVQVPRVDRCQTCHVNVAESDPAFVGFEDTEWGSVFASHPRLDLFVGSTSPHPLEQFGCTTCHWGDGHATDFSYAAHTPDGEHEEEEWKEKYGWHHLKYQDYPMLPSRYVTAGCRKCHMEEEYLEGGGRYNRGFRLVKNYGCFGCHKIEQFTDEPKVGPSLLHIADKVDLDFLYKWIRDPQRFRSSTRMPHFFDLTNSRGSMEMIDVDGELFDADFDVRNGIEALALATYIFDASERRTEHYQLASEGDPARGRQIFREIGCLGCHSVKDESSSPDGPGDLDALVAAARDGLGALAGTATQTAGTLTDAQAAPWRELGAAATSADEALAALPDWLMRLPVGIPLERVRHRAARAVDAVERVAEPLGAGAEAIAASRAAIAELASRWAHQTRAPDLSGLGSKVKDRDWLADWIVDPRRHDVKTIMPRFRLEEDEGADQRIADIVAYLMSLRDPAFEEEPVFAIDTELKSKVLENMVFDYKRREKDGAAGARAELPGMPTDERLRFLGHRLLQRYGCFGCHVGIRDVYNQQDPAATFDLAQPIGTELEGWGIKEVKRLDFGHWGHQHNGEWAIPSERYAWAQAKLSDTRRFDVLPNRTVSPDGHVEYVATPRLLQKTHEELLKMPLFPFADQPDDVEAVVTYLLSLQKDPILMSKLHRLDAEEAALDEGRQLIERLNCQGCHRIGAETKFVPVDELPSFSIFEETTEEQKRKETLEIETWLARGVKLHFRTELRVDARDVLTELSSKDSEIKVEPGTPFPFGSVIGEQVWDWTTMNPDEDEPLSLVELARRHHEATNTPEDQRLLALGGYEEGLIREYLGASAQERFRAPPPLVRQGERVRAEWLLRFLMDVKVIRPMLKVRMPSFHLTQDDARAIVRWFKLRSGLPEGGELFESDWKDEALSAEGLATFNELQCNSCHPAGAVLPTEPILYPADKFDWKEFPFPVPDDSAFVVWKDDAGEFRIRYGFTTNVEAQAWAQGEFAGRDVEWVAGDAWDKSAWGPDLGLAAERLRPAWIYDWLKNPPDFMPGTKMPMFFGDRSDPIAGHPLEAVADAFRSGALTDDEKSAAEQNRRRMLGLLQYLAHMRSMAEVARGENGADAAEPGASRGGGD